MQKSVATIIVVTNLKPNVLQSLHSRGSVFERCIVILTDNIFYLKICLFLRSGSAYEWPWSKVQKNPMHSPISDLNVKLELGDGVKSLIFFETTNHFSS